MIQFFYTCASNHDLVHYSVMLITFIYSSYLKKAVFTSTNIYTFVFLPSVFPYSIWNHACLRGHTIVLLGTLHWSAYAERFNRSMERNLALPWRARACLYSSMFFSITLLQCHHRMVRFLLLQVISKSFTLDILSTRTSNCRQRHDHGACA